MRSSMPPSDCGASCSRQSTRTTSRPRSSRRRRGILGGLWEKVRERPAEFLDSERSTSEGLDVAAKDFLAGMTDRYAVNLYEQLFIPKSWVDIRG